MHEYRQSEGEAPVYEEITATAVGELTEEKPSSVDLIKTEENVVYQRTSATILTSVNESYGYIH